EETLPRVIQRGCWSELEWFNDAAGWSVAEGASEDEVVVRHLGREIGRRRLPLSGSHNRANALAAIAAARHVGVTPEVALDALTRFEGVKRRLELRGNVRGVAVYDDFAHHPTAITLTVEGLRRQVGDARILAVLEPRSNTMKLGVMKDQIPASLTQADKVFCYAANLGWDARAALQPIAAKTVVEDDLDALVAAIVAEARDGDRILVMSNGGFGGIHGKLLAALGQ
ncbi:MAG TPA: cyanophycin synthetase, partial [Zoogloea sp.]|nr:cyanophycin synthetase [Zoogloea sp.]